MHHCQNTPSYLVKLSMAWHLFSPRLNQQNIYGVPSSSFFSIHAYLYFICLDPTFFLCFMLGSLCFSCLLFFHCSCLKVFALVLLCINSITSHLPFGYLGFLFPFPIYYPLAGFFCKWIVTYIVLMNEIQMIFIHIFQEYILHSSILL